MFKWLSRISKDPDWQDWARKIRWQLASFKSLAFWSFIILLITAFRCLWHIYFRTIEASTELYKLGYLTKDGLSNIITHSQTVIFDTALSHVLIFAGTAITAIIAIQGVNYVTDARKTSEVLKKMDTPNTPKGKEDLKAFLPKPGN